MNATSRQLLNHHGGEFTRDVVYDPLTNRFITADYTRLHLIESGRIIFSSERIALDGIRDLKIQGRLIRGLAVTDYDKESHEELESAFTFNIDTQAIEFLKRMP